MFSERPSFPNGPPIEGLTNEGLDPNNYEFGIYDTRYRDWLNNYFETLTHEEKLYVIQIKQQIFTKTSSTHYSASMALFMKENKLRIE